jgi:hypothetical protein
VSEGIFNTLSDERIEELIEVYASEAPESFWMDGEFEGSYEERVEDLKNWWKQMDPEMQQSTYDDCIRFQKALKELEEMLEKNNAVST